MPGTHFYSSSLRFCNSALCVCARVRVWMCAEEWLYVPMLIGCTMIAFYYLVGSSKIAYNICASIFYNNTIQVCTLHVLKQVGFFYMVYMEFQFTLQNTA